LSLLGSSPLVAWATPRHLVLGLGNNSYEYGSRRENQRKVKTTKTEVVYQVVLRILNQQEKCRKIWTVKGHEKEQSSKFLSAFIYAVWVGNLMLTLFLRGVRLAPGRCIDEARLVMPMPLRIQPNPNSNMVL
jgi:hypothetical protein